MGNYLSHSQCETFTQCPRRWQLQKIEGAPQAPAEALILGSVFHAVVEKDGLRIMAGEKPHGVIRLGMDFQELLEDALDKDDPDRLLGIGAFGDMWAKGQAMLEAYVTHLQPRYAPLAVESSFEVAIPGANGWQFIGRIDARARMSDGTLAIIDFKTGKAWDRGAEHSKPQASAYLMADSINPPLAQAQAVCFVVFPTEPDGNGGYTCMPQFRVTTRTNAQIDAYARYLVATAEQITEARRSGEFPAKVGPLCGWCGVLGSCQQGQAWLASKGRKPAVPMVSKQQERSAEGGGDAA